MRYQLSGIAVLTLLLLPASALRADNSWVPAAGPGGQWHDADRWTSGVPTALQDVVLNVPTTSSFARIHDPIEPAVAASVRVGDEKGNFGCLRISSGSLIVRLVPGNTASGQLQIGSQGGDGKCSLSGAGIGTDRDIVLGSGSGATGQLRVDPDSRLVCRRLRLSTSVSTSGRLIVYGGDSDIRMDRLLTGNGEASLLFVAAPHVSQITSLLPPMLGGRLKVNLRNFSGNDAEVLFIENLSDRPCVGGFDEVVIVDGASGYYELTYEGGDGNDLALRRSEVPVDNYTTWQGLHFAPSDDPKITRPMADPDSDGLSNAAEYAMGRSPLQPESIGPQGNSSLDGGIVTATIDYVTRTDRPDVHLIPLARPTGDIWQSKPFDIAQTGIDGNVAQIRATAHAFLDIEVKLYAELLPEPGRTLNVLLIVVDDLNDWVGCLQGHPQAHTPHLDRLAARGMLFREAHAAATICNPSRISLLTGVRPATSGVYRNPQEFRDNRLLGSALTMPQHYRNNGYTAAGAGKVFHDPDPQSWDEYWPSMTRYRPRDALPAERHQNGILTRGTQFDWGPLDVSVSRMSDFKIARWVGGRIESQPPGSPLFLACGFRRPHLPFFAPAKYFDRFGSVDLPPTDPYDLDDLPLPALNTLGGEDQAAVEEANQWEAAVRGYLAATTFVDDQLGRLLDSLDDSPHGRNTIIVFTSDHGFFLGQKRHWRKQVLWNHCTHVPLVIVAPGTTTPGTVCDSAVSLLDIFPTLADLSELPRLSQMEGESLVPMLEDGTRQRSRPVLTTRYRKEHSVRDDRYHLIQYADGSRELYDVWLDRHEWNNLAEEPGYQEIVDRLSASLPTHNARNDP